VVKKQPSSQTLRTKLGDLEMKKTTEGNVMDG